MNDFLWSPVKKKCQSSNLFDFYQFIENKYKVQFENNYELLWNWSITERSKFWLSLVEFLNLKYQAIISLQLKKIIIFIMRNFSQILNSVMLKILSKI